MRPNRQGTHLLLILSVITMMLLGCLGSSPTVPEGEPTIVPSPAESPTPSSDVTAVPTAPATITSTISESGQTEKVPEKVDLPEIFIIDPVGSEYTLNESLDVSYFNIRGYAIHTKNITRVDAQLKGYKRFTLKQTNARKVEFNIFFVLSKGENVVDIYIYDEEDNFVKKSVRIIGIPPP